MPHNPLLDQIIPAGKPWSAIVAEGHYLSIIDIEGQQGVDFLCYNAANPEERYHAPNTLKAIQSLKLSAGHNLYSDIARPIFTITHDSCDGHDTIGGCCSAPSNEMLYGVKNVPGCRENFLSALSEHGLGRRDIVIFVEMLVLLAWQPRPMRGLVVDAQEKWLRLIVLSPQPIK